MEEHKEIALSADPVAAGNRSAAIRDDWRRLLINSLVLAVTIPALIWCSGDDLLLAGWRLWLFVISYLFGCICFFSATPASLGKIFVTLSYVGLLAFLAGSLLGNVLGMVIMCLDSVLAAALFGATLARHRQGKGTETAAIVAAANDRAIHRKPQSRRPAYYMIGFVALCYSPRLVWLMLADSPVVDVAVSLLGAIGFVQLVHISCVLGWLNISDSVPVMLYFACVAWVFFCSYIVMGEVVGVTVLWLSILASTAFLGYYHQVHASYEEITSGFLISELKSASRDEPATEILVV